MASEEKMDLSADQERRSLLLPLLANFGYLLLILAVFFWALALIPQARPVSLLFVVLLAAIILWPGRVELLRRIGARMTASPSTSAPENADLDGVSRILHATTDCSVLLPLLHAQIGRLVPSRSFRVALYDDRSDSLYYPYSSDQGRRMPDCEGSPFPATQDLCGVVARTGAALIADSYAEACRIHSIPMRDPECAWAGVPLAAGPQVTGVMVLLRPEPFTDRDRRLLEAIAAHAGPSIARARLEHDAKRRAKLLDTLQRVSRRLIGTLAREDLLDLILAGARELFPAEATLLLLPDPSGGWTVSRSAGLPESFSEQYLPAADLPPQKVFGNDRFSFLGAVSQEGFFRSLDLAGLGVRGTFCLPLNRREVRAGCILFFNPASFDLLFTEEDSLLTAYAMVAVAALEDSRGLNQTGEPLATLGGGLESLQNLDQELNEAADSVQAMSTVLGWALRHTGALAGLAAVPIENGFEVLSAEGYPEGLRPEPGVRLPGDFSGLGEAMQTGRPVLRRTAGSTAVGIGLHPESRAGLALPIRREKRVMGILFLESTMGETFTGAQGDFLERLAAHAAAAIFSAQLYAEVQAANQAKSEFISFVAHELKTPMTSIRGYTDLIAQGAVGPVSPPQANFLATIRANADRMAALVSDLNDVSRIDSGRLRLDFSGCALGETLQEVIESLHSQIDAKEQKLALEIPADLPLVWADHGRLIQILTNLVSNAHKYTPAGGSLRIAAERSANRWDPAGPPDVVHCLVQDSGFGISPQEQKDVFQKFFRSADRLVRDLPGTGLGLHITRNLVELQGGRIWFESEMGHGTTFHFTLPVASA